MKKVRIVVFGVATLLILAGCQRSAISEDAQSVETTAATNIEATSLIEESTATTESSTSSQQNALEEFEEAPIIETTIDVSNLQLKIETDNPKKRVLFFSTDTGQKRCHRVVNHAGRLVPGWAEQAELLHNEGVFLKDSGYVDLKKYQWEC